MMNENKLHADDQKPVLNKILPKNFMSKLSSSFVADYVFAC